MAAKWELVLSFIAFSMICCHSQIHTTTFICTELHIVTPINISCLCLFMELSKRFFIFDLSEDFCITLKHIQVNAGSDTSQMIDIKDH